MKKNYISPKITVSRITAEFTMLQGSFTLDADAKRFDMADEEVVVDEENTYEPPREWFEE